MWIRILRQIETGTTDVIDRFKNKGGITMELIKYTLEENIELTPEQIDMLEKAKEKPITFDADSPKLTEDMMKVADRPNIIK